jgi:ABC-type phosphate transport system substrate-binding protein
MSMSHGRPSSHPTHAAVPTGAVIDDRLIAARRLITMVILALCLTAKIAGAQSGFAVIVNASNPVTTLSKDEATKLFLKRVTKWETGAPVQPIDLPENAAARESFCSAVLRRSVSAVRAYWQQQIFSGRGVPPVEKPSESEVIAFVRANPGAIAYVSPSAAQSNGVKIVSVE